MRDEILFLFKNHQKEIGSHSALKKSALPQPSGNEKKEVMMELTKENLESMYAESMRDVSVCVSILEGKVSTLDTYDRGISDIMANHPDLREKYSPEDARSLRDLLIRLTREGLKKKTLRRVEKKINEMVRAAISSVEEAGVSLSQWPWCYLHQYKFFLCDLKYLITTELFLYSLSNSTIRRELRELSEPADLAD